MTILGKRGHAPMCGCDQCGKNGALTMAKLKILELQMENDGLRARADAWDRVVHREFGGDDVLRDCGAAVFEELIAMRERS